MQPFNNGEPYHGSDNVERGKLRGATGETDYFYFFCPICPDDTIMRVLEFGEHFHTPENEYNEHCDSTTKYGFGLVFKLHCETCGHNDFVKVSNTGWQGGKHSEIIARFSPSSS